MEKRCLPNYKITLTNSHYVNLHLVLGLFQITVKESHVYSTGACFLSYGVLLQTTVKHHYIVYSEQEYI